MGNPSEVAGAGAPFDESHLELQVGQQRPARRCGRLVRAAVLLAHFTVLWLVLRTFLAYCPMRSDVPEHTELIPFTYDEPDHDGVKFSCFDPAELAPSEAVLDPHHKDWQSARGSVKIPANAATLFVAKHGPLAVGEITFEEDNELKGDDVVVNVEIQYKHKNHAKICEVEFEENGGQGVAILTPKKHHPHGKDIHRVFINVIFPTSSTPLRIRAFKTFLPLFKHKVDLTEAVELESLSLNSAEGPIEVKSVTAASGRVHTRNAAIVGHFNASELELITENAPIDVSVNLKSRDAETPGKLSLYTANARLLAAISLFSFEGSGGVFDVNATTANAPLKVHFPAAPTDSVLHLKAHTANGPAGVILHPSYEGSFDVLTSIFNADVTYEPATEDPSGEGRKRQVETNAVGRTHIVGETYWGEKTDKTPKGDVILHSSISPAVLRLNPPLHEERMH